MKILNIYGQFDYHSPARIIGNREGLEHLKNTIEQALKSCSANTNIKDEQGKLIDCLFASDGEGYELTIEMNNDEWGLSDLEPEAKTNFWNQRKNYPFYIRVAVCEMAHNMEDYYRNE
jgi:hypothetical protein